MRALLRTSIDLVWRKGGWFLPLVALAYLLGFGLQAFVMAVDPFDLRPTGMNAKLDQRAYPDRAIPRLVSAVAKSDHDLVVLGASTSMGYTPEMLRRAFPDARNPFNLSFGALRKEEMALILDQLLAKDPALKRVVLSLDVTTLNDVNMMGRLLPTRYYAPRWYDLVPEYDQESLSVAWSVARTGAIDSPAWPRRGPLPNWADGVSIPFQQPGAMAKLQRAADLTRSTVLDGDPPTCREIDGLNQVVIPYARKLAARGIEVEVLTAPFAMSAYSDWAVNWPRHNFIRREGIYANLMALRRCAVEGLEGIPHVRVHSFDTDLALVGDMRNYFDSAHLVRPEAYQYVLDSIAARSHLLNEENFAAYEAKLRQEVSHFNPSVAGPLL